MNKISLKVDPERAKAIGRLLFQKYDISKRGVLEPKQCFEVFSDFCYRILVIDSTIYRAYKNHQLWNKQNLCIKYLISIKILELLRLIFKI